MSSLCLSRKLQQKVARGRCQYCDESGLIIPIVRTTSSIAVSVSVVSERTLADEFWSDFFIRFRSESVCKETAQGKAIPAGSDDGSNDLTQCSTFNNSPILACLHCICSTYFQCGSQSALRYCNRYLSKKRGNRAIGMRMHWLTRVRKLRTTPNQLRK